MKKSLKIAIIADSPEDRSALENALARIADPDVETRQTSSDAEGLAALQSFQPQVALLSLNVSDARAEQAVRLLQDISPDLVLFRLVQNEKPISPVNPNSKMQELHPPDLEPIPLRRRIEEALRQDAQGSQERRVLIIDDSPDDQELYARALKKVQTVDYQVKIADNGEEGLAAIGSFRPDCLLLDYSLPGRDGLEILKALRVSNPYLPVVFLTGYGNDRLAVEAMRCGAQDYISKSNISKELLHQTIQNACERQALQQRVKNQQEALTLFARALAHDLKEPLRSVRSFCQLVTGSGELTPSNHEYLDIAISAIDHMNRLVDTVRAYTSLQDEQAPANLRRFPAQQAVDQALTNLRQQLNEVPHDIEVGKLPEISGDEAQIVSLFQNLISNALNYGDKPVCKLEIRSDPSAEGNVFTISDNGPGVDSSFADRIFKPFKRLSDGRRKGSGLGLAICQKIVERHQGRIWLESGDGSGSIFRFILPAVDQSKNPKETVSSIHEESENQKLRTANVLHVEDNPSDVLLTKLMLQKRDQVQLNIYNVNNGLDALTFLADNHNPKIDLILLDINMPVMDGFEFLRHFKENGHGRAVPVIVCSTSDDNADQRNARDLGAKAYVVKPINLANLEPAIRALPSFVLSRRDKGVRLEIAC